MHSPYQRLNRSNTPKIIFIIGFVLFLFLCFLISVEADEGCGKFPDGFMFGVGSSAYQVEGAWNEDNKGESILDYSFHNPNWTSGNGDVACDAYHNTEPDIQLLRNLKVDFYRFSISWTRILPTGESHNVNQLGLNYYHQLIDNLLNNSIQPVVTIYHWDLPQKLQEFGGWTNSIIVDYYLNYADILFREFGDKVKWWITVNEPILNSMVSMGDSFEDQSLPPMLDQPGRGIYLCVHNMLLAHATAFHRYRSQYQPQQQGKIGIVENIFNYRPKTNSSNDSEAARRALFTTGTWLLDPLLKGDYPEELKQMVAEQSTLEGRTRSRLPEFTEEQKQLLSGSLDFFGLNYYSSMETSEGPPSDAPSPSFVRDLKATTTPDPEAPAHGVEWLRDYPAGLRNVLKWLHERYSELPIFITENGTDDPGGLEDTNRVKYHQGHLKEIYDALNENINIIGYTVWSFMDSFEWLSGYSTSFGVYQVDFNDPSRTRTPKQSFHFFETLFRTKILQNCSTAEEDIVNN